MITDVQQSSLIHYHNGILYTIEYAFIYDLRHYSNGSGVIVLNDGFHRPVQFKNADQVWLFHKKFTEYEKRFDQTPKIDWSTIVIEAEEAKNNYCKVNEPPLGSYENTNGVHHRIIGSKNPNDLTARCDKLYKTSWRCQGGLVFDGRIYRIMMTREY